MTKKMGRPAKEVTKKRVNITLDPQLHEEVQERLEKEGISFSSFVEQYLQNYIQKEA